MRGFHTAHIWACPPLKGDDYILYCHPQDQKTPKDDRLRHWYSDMLKICQQRGIVESMSDLYTEFLVDQTHDATVLPYFEGDYWVNEAEVIIANLASKRGVVGNDDEGDPVEVETGTQKRKSTTKSKRTRASKGTIISKSERDPVMAKLAAIIEPMKEAFFVAKLLPDEFAKLCAHARQKEVDGDNTTDPELKRCRSSTEFTGETSAVSATSNETASSAPVEDSVVKMEENMKDIKTEETGIVKSEPNPIKDEKDKQSDGGSSEPAQGTGVIEEKIKDENIQVKLEGNMIKSEPMDVTDSSQPTITSSTQEDEKTNPTDSLSHSEAVSTAISGAGKTCSDEGGIGTITALSSSQEGTRKESIVSDSHEQKDELPIDKTSGDISSEHSESQQILSTTVTSTTTPIIKAPVRTLQYHADGHVIDETEDPDDTQECEFFDTRQAFLNLCQGNHYQFDQLRRAKHTSMMVLYHLHNPDAPNLFQLVIYVPKKSLQDIDIIVIHVKLIFVMIVSLKKELVVIYIS
eukprot:CAMPEP_0182423844 /NCGR_PEP_ID=MMETSP1167-20130531/9918_1 /TAXON_ID=2988 /ORGANISM="Mallomonas Sp, Strain CCMP3275" /LENGTH=519 /DNA_ID=CAMNT_0024603145 /DNA_START=677 /DNA_END=2237 /DNA_ORIENTATION=+